MSSAEYNRQLPLLTSLYGDFLSSLKTNLGFIDDKAHKHLHRVFTKDCLKAGMPALYMVCPCKYTVQEIYKEYRRNLSVDIDYGYAESLTIDLEDEKTDYEPQIIKVLERLQKYKYSFCDSTNFRRLFLLRIINYNDKKQNPLYIKHRKVILDFFKARREYESYNHGLIWIEGSIHSKQLVGKADNISRNILTGNIGFYDDINIPYDYADEDYMPYPALLTACPEKHFPDLVQHEIDNILCRNVRVPVTLLVDPLLKTTLLWKYDQYCRLDNILMSMNRAFGEKLNSLNLTPNDKIEVKLVLGDRTVQWSVNGQSDGPPELLLNDEDVELLHKDFYDRTASDPMFPSMEDYQRNEMSGHLALVSQDVCPNNNSTKMVNSISRDLQKWQNASLRYENYRMIMSDKEGNELMNENSITMFERIIKEMATMKGEIYDLQRKVDNMPETKGGPKLIAYKKRKLCDFGTIHKCRHYGAYRWRITYRPPNRDTGYEQHYMSADTSLYDVAKKAFELGLSRVKIEKYLPKIGATKEETQQIMNKMC